VTDSCPYRVTLTLDCLGAAATSPSHAFDTRSDGKIVLSDVVPDRDIVFYIDLEKSASAVYQKIGDDRFVSMVTCYPPVAPVETSKGEFVFLVDRSGSMDGDAIRQAKNAMRVILKSIPVDSHFNIVGFGTRFEELFAGGGSRLYTRETHQQAERYVSKMDASMGGTEIFAPLEKILSRQSAEGYQKQIFVLTDGQVADVEPVLALIAKHKDSCRVFSLGLGSSACHALVNGMARAGNGAALYSTVSEKMQEKLVNLMLLAMKPSVPGPKLEWNVGVETLIPARPDPVFQGLATVSFGWFSSAPSLLSVGGVGFEVRDVSDRASPLALYRLSAKRRIEELEEEHASEPADRCEADIEADILKLCLECNIVSKFASFVAVGDLAVYDVGQTRQRVTIANQMPFGMGQAVCDNVCDSGPRTAQSAGPRPLGKAAEARPVPTPRATFVVGGDDDDEDDCFGDLDDEQAIVRSIIASQQFDGCFKIDARLAAKISCPNRAEPTEFVVDYLEKYCLATRSTWILVAQKARDYLKRRAM